MRDAKEQLEEGQGALCDIIKTVLYEEDETIFERLDFYKDRIFLEPMLFTYCVKKELKKLKEQILFGYYLPKDRPKQLKVYTNKKGVVYLANYGLLKTKEQDAELLLEYNAAKDSLMLKKDHVLLPFEQKKLQYLNAVPTIELTSSIDLCSMQVFYEFPRVDKALIDEVLTGEQVNIATYQPALEEAWTILKDFFPQEFEKYTAVTHKIVLFSCPQLRNFATKESHGTIYLNVDENSTVGFFLEELIHQCSHVVFNAMTCATEDLFLVDYNRTVGEFAGNYDRRTLYSALHGIYTTGQIVSLLLDLVKACPPLEEETLYEIIGRIAINKKRHNIGLEKVPLEEVFTPKGQALFLLYYKQLDKNIQQNPSFFDYDLKEHPIVFNYQKFKDDNPISFKYPNVKMSREK